MITPLKGWTLCPIVTRPFCSMGDWIMGMWHWNY